MLNKMWPLLRRKRLLSLLVFAEGLRGSLSELISRHELAKSRHPDCSMVLARTHAHTHRFSSVLMLL